jgi:photosystem II stability/assembly factor-like uncharacterized protein
MKMILPTKRTTLRIGLLLALGIISMWGWLLFNIYVFITPLWVDFLFGCALVIFYLILSPDLPQSIQKNRWFKLSSGLLLLLALYAGIFYVTQYENILDQSQNGALSFFSTALKWISDLIIAVPNTGFTSNAIVELTVTYLFTSVLAIIVAVCGRAIFISYNTTIQTFIQSIIKKASIRTSRLRHYAAIIVTFLLSSIFLLGAIFLLINKNSPMAPVRISTVSAPTANLLPSSLLSRSDGSLYALINGRIYRYFKKSGRWDDVGKGLPEGASVESLIKTNDDTLFTNTVSLIYRMRADTDQWEEANTGLPPGVIIMSFVKAEDGTLFIRTDLSIYRLRVGTNKWEETGAGIPTASFGSLIVSNDGTIFYRASSGTYRLQSGTQVWEAIHDEILAKSYNLQLNYDRSYIYAVKSDGVYRSSDQAKSWENIGETLPVQSIGTLVESNNKVYTVLNGNIYQLPSGTERWENISNYLTSGIGMSSLASTDDGRIFAHNYVSVYRLSSEDNQWELLDSGLPQASIYSLVAGKNGTMLANTVTGIYRLEKDGTKWEIASTESPRGGISSLLIREDGSIFTSNYTGIYRLQAETRKWENISTGLSQGTVVSSLQAGKNGIVFAITSTGVYRLRADSEKWEDVNAGLPQQMYIGTFLTADDGTIFTNNSMGVYRLRVNSNKWESVATGLPIGTLSSLLMGKEGNLYISNNSGIYRMRAGAERWEQLGNQTSFVSSLGYGAKLFLAGDTLYANVANSLYYWNENRSEWSAPEIENLLSVGSVTVNNWIENARGDLYVGTTNGLLFRKKDETKFKALNAGLPIANGIELFAFDDALFANTPFGIYRSQDHGQNWKVIDDITRSVYFIKQVGKSFFASNSFGFYRSRDQGFNWEKVDTLPVAPYTFLGRDKDTFYVNSDSKIYQLQTDGSLWHNLKNLGLPTDSTTLLVVGSSNSGIIFAQSGYGLYYSRDHGMRWNQSACIGISNCAMRSIVVDKKGFIYSITDSGSYVSKDNGDTWEILGGTENFSSANVTKLDVDTRGAIYLLSNDKTLYRSNGIGHPFIRVSRFGLDPDDVINEFALANDGSIFITTTVNTSSLDTTNKIYQSAIKGLTWKQIAGGLPDTQNLFVQNSNILYVKAGNEIYRLREKKEGWVNQKLTLPKDASSIDQIVLQADGTLFIQPSSFNGMVYRSNDQGDRWEAVSDRIPGQFTNSIFAGSDGTIFNNAGTGMYRSVNNGDNWEAINITVPVGQNVNSVLGNVNKVLYAETSTGIYRSEDQGKNWDEINIPTDYGFVHLTGMDNRGAIYISSSNKLFSSTSKGTKWEKMSDEFPTGDVASFMEFDGNLFALVNSKLYRSQDRGKLWVEINVVSSNYMALFPGPDNAVYLKSSDFNFRSSDKGEHWKKISSPIFGAPEWFSTLYPDHPLSPLFNLGTTASEFGGYYSRTNEFLFPQQDQILDIQFYVPHSSNRFWVQSRNWSAKYLVPNVPKVFYGIIGVFILLFVVSYFNIGKVFGIPIWSFIIARRRLEDYSSKEILEHKWGDWKKIILNELKTYGDVCTFDLIDIPKPFRSYALRRFVSEYANLISIKKIRKDQIQLTSNQNLKRWRSEQRLISSLFDPKTGLPANAKPSLDTLSSILAEALEMQKQTYQEGQSSYIWQVQASNLQLNLPTRFPMIFLADAVPSEETVRTLFDMVGGLKESSYFALVIPLEFAASDHDIADDLKRVIKAAPYAHDFVVLSNNDVIDILIAKSAERGLAEKIGGQIDLNFISPFIVNGPVPPQMFFGREKEIRQLVDHASSRNFAIVGNRKIGKTSLLNRVENYLGQQSIYVLRMDCQTVRQPEDFYILFERVSNHPLIERTPDEFGITMMEISKVSQTPLVLMIDELDDLLDVESRNGESLISVWRQLANAGVCHFIFCGSKMLALQLRNSASAMFNFPEQITLSYLRREETDEVISRPLETLGVVIQDKKVVLESVWDLTSGHPNVSQFVGRALVEAANRRKDRKIYPEDIEALWSDSIFIDFYFDTIWGRANPLEILITILATNNGFTITEMENKLLQLGIILKNTELDQALAMLSTYSILDRKGKQYYLFPQAFSNLLNTNFDRDYLINREKNKLQGISK